MTERLVERTLRALGDGLASSAAVPGGGSAAAYAGAMGAALAAMVGRIAERKEKSDETTALIADADRLRADFIRLVDDDSAAYAQVSAAMKLPKRPTTRSERGPNGSSRRSWRRRACRSRSQRRAAGCWTSASERSSVRRPRP